MRGDQCPPVLTLLDKTLEQNILKIEYLTLKHAVFESMTYAGSVDKWNKKLSDGETASRFIAKEYN